MLDVQYALFRIQSACVVHQFRLRAGNLIAIPQNLALFRVPSSSSTFASWNFDVGFSGKRLDELVSPVSHVQKTDAHAPPQPHSTPTPPLPRPTPPSSARCWRCGVEIPAELDAVEAHEAIHLRRSTDSYLRDSARNDASVFGLKPVIPFQPGFVGHPGPARYFLPRGSLSVYLARSPSSWCPF